MSVLAGLGWAGWLGWAKWLIFIYSLRIQVLERVLSALFQKNFPKVLPERLKYRVVSYEFKGKSMEIIAKSMKLQYK